MRLDRPLVGEHASRTASSAHPLEDAPLGANGAVRDEGAVRAPACRFHELPVADEPGNRRINLRERVAPRRMPERERLHLGLGEHRGALLDGGDRPGDRFEHAELGRERERGWGGGARGRRRGVVERRVGEKVGQRRHPGTVAQDVRGQLRRRDPHSR